MKRKPEDKKDLEECKDKIDDLLKKYNCTLYGTEYYTVVIRHNDLDDEIDYV